MKIIPRAQADENRKNAIEAAERQTVELFDRERAFVRQLAEYAKAYGIDLTQISDINISTLKEAATNAGATEAEILNMATTLQTMSFDIAACSDANWKDTWAAFKARIPAYLEEIINQ